MVGFIFCILAIVGTFIATRRSLGAGLQALIVVGYLYGLARGRYPDVLTHFPFDCALVTLYAVHFSRRPSNEAAHRSAVAMNWTRALVIWPIVCMAYSPMLASSQPMIIQIVGFRGAVLMMPCLVLGAQAETRDLDKVAMTLGIMNLAALGLGVFEYVYGIAAVLPHNAATEIIYRSQDISASGEYYHRIPSMFTSSHGYGGMMILSVPFLLHGVEAKEQKVLRILCFAGLGAAIIGIFLCGARLPVIALALATVYVLLTLRLRGSALIGLLITGACAYYLVTHNERLQRFETLADTEGVEARVSNSVNMSLIDAFGNYPIGAGLASAFGSSIPFFLADQANGPIGIESEFGHMLVEQGIVGLLMLLGFLGWTFSRTRVPWKLSSAASGFASVLVIVEWLTAGIGAGILSGIPTSAFLLLLTGMRIAVPPRAVTVKALRHIGVRPRAGPMVPQGARVTNVMTR